jgi:hypothetical protein
MSLPVVKHTFFPFLKYSKDKTTKKIDLTKPPSIRAKVPNYNGKWGVEIYDTKQQRIFPCDNENMTPMDFIPKMSNVACVLQCSGLWFGGKGWGLTWKLIQCVVKPREVVSVYGRCHIQLTSDDIIKMDSIPQVKDDDDDIVASSPPVVSTEVEDSDVEDEQQAVVADPTPLKKMVKKVVAVPETVDDVPEMEAEADVAVVAAPKKKVIKKAK